MDEPTNGHDAEGITGTAAAAALAERTLTGDLRDYVIDLIRTQRNLWPMLNEMQQTNLAAEIEHECETLVQRAVGIIAGRDFTAIGVGLEQIAFKPKGTEAKLTFGLMDARVRHELVDAQGGRIVLVIADPDVYRGSRGLAAVDKDQPELPIAAGAAPAPHEIAGDLPAPGDVDTLSPEPPEQIGYRAGYGDGLDGIAWGEAPYDEGTPERARYEAGWWAAMLEGIDDPAKRETHAASAEAHFVEMGKAAAAAGAQPTDCPFPEWMPARDWWNAGFFADATDEAQDEQPKRRRSRKGDDGQAPAP